MATQTPKSYATTRRRSDWAETVYYPFDSEANAKEWLDERIADLMGYGPSGSISKVVIAGQDYGWGVYLGCYNSCD